MTVAAVQRIAKASTAGTSTIDSGTGWATPTAGNLIVVTANSDATVTMTSSGYTAGPSVVDNNAVYAWYKVAAGTETSVVVTLGASTEIVHTACEYSGLTASPFDVSNTSTIPNTDGSSTTSVSVTTTADGDLVIALAGLADFSGSGANPTSPSWTNSFTNQITSVSTGAIGVRCNSFYSELIAGAAGAVSTSCSWTNSAFKRQQLVLAFKAAATTSIPWAPQRLAQTRDPGEVPWIQRDRRDANTVTTAANDLDVPLLVMEQQRWHSAYRDRRLALVPQQPDRHLRALDAAAANDLVPPLLVGDGGQDWHLYADTATRDRSVRVQQRAYLSDPSLLSPATSMPPPPPTRVVPARDPGEVAWLQRANRDVTLLATALLENELLGGADVARHSTGATHANRRLIPQQRPYISDPSFYPDLDPLTVAFGPGGHYWLLCNTAALTVDRRLIPRQRPYVSDPGLLDTALLEGPLLVGCFRFTVQDRRSAPQQPARFAALGADAEPVEIAGGVGGDTWRRYNLPAYGDRREVPQQPARQTVYFDLGPGSAPLTLAWGAGGSLWHRYNHAADLYVRMWWPPQQRPWPTVADVAVGQGSPITSIAPGGRITSSTPTDVLISQTIGGRL